MPSFHAANRRRSTQPVPWDGVALITFPGQPTPIPIDDLLPEVRAGQQMVDAMPADWRRLVHEFGDDAMLLWEQSTPVFAGQGRMSAERAAQILRSQT